MNFFAPSFWYHPHKNIAARCLSPFTLIPHFLSRYRSFSTPKKVSVPVFCCGNVTVGGTGKTPIAIDLAKRLQELNKVPHFLTRGYKGKEKEEAQLICPGCHTAEDVGDESLLLAKIAPTWRGKNRYLTAQKAIHHGADCLIMDDGLQNTTLHKDFSFLIIDGETGFGNNMLLPAGPLREKPQNIYPDIHAVIIMGSDKQRISQSLPKNLPILNASYIPNLDIQFLQTKQIIAFAGISRPKKFFQMLYDYGLSLSRCIPYPDHHLYRQKDLKYLTSLSETSGTILVTTSKDAVKLPQYLLRNIYIVDVNIFYDNPSQINDIILQNIPHKISQ